MTADRGALVTLRDLEQLAEFALGQGAPMAELGGRLALGIARFRAGRRFGVKLEDALGWSTGPTGTAAQRKARQILLLREAAGRIDGSARSRARAIAKGVAAAARHGPWADDGETFAGACAEIARLGIEMPGFEAIRKIIAVG